jgi:hypothetical protein
VQADKTNVATQIPFWGCPVISFEAQLPFYEVREDFAASERDPNRPFCSANEFFQKSKLIRCAKSGFRYWGLLESPASAGLHSFERDPNGPHCLISER